MRTIFIKRDACVYNVTVTFVNSLGKESELRTHSKSIKDRRESEELHRPANKQTGPI